MIKFLKKIFLYKWFLFTRMKFFTNEKLLIQLTKRTHSLDKSITSGNINPVFNFEVRELLKEISKREWDDGSNISEITKWSWELLYMAEFSNKKESKSENEEAIVKDSANNDSISTIIKGRRSVRIWKGESPKVDDIKRLLDIAKWSPNSCNRQLWKVLIIDKDEEKKELEMICHQPFIFKAPTILVTFIKLKEYGEEEENYAYLDTGAFIQNFLLLAHSEGLGCCWIGIKQSDEYQKNFKAFGEKFNVPDGYIPTSIISIGYPEKTPYAPPRKSLSDILIR